MLNDEFKRVNRELLPGEVERVSSAREMTGMVSALPQGEEQAQSYEELLPVHAQKPDEKDDVLPWEVD